MEKITKEMLLENQELVKNCSMKKHCAKRELGVKSPCGLKLYCSKFYENYMDHPDGYGHYPEGPPHFGAPKPEYECKTPLDTLESWTYGLLTKVYADIEDCRAKKHAWTQFNLCWRDTTHGDSLTCRCVVVCDMCNQRMKEWDENIGHHPSHEKTRPHSALGGSAPRDRTRDVYFQRQKRAEKGAAHSDIQVMSQEEIHEQRRRSQFQF